MNATRFLYWFVIRIWMTFNTKCIKLEWTFGCKFNFSFKLPNAWKWRTILALLLLWRCECFCFGKNKYQKRSKHEVQTRHTHIIEVSFTKQWIWRHFGVVRRPKSSPEIVLDLCIDINSNMVLKSGRWVTLRGVFFMPGLCGGRGRARSTYLRCSLMEASLVVLNIAFVQVVPFLYSFFTACVPFL